MAGDLRILMKHLLTLGIFALLASCSTSSSGSWPARTRDPNLKIVDSKHTLSASDITAIHELVWSKNPRLGIFGMEAVGRDTVLVSVSPQTSEKVTIFGACDAIKKGGRWELGKYRSGSIAGGF
jgi:hypothetical protein